MPTILVFPIRGCPEMDTNSTEFISLRVSRRAAKNIAIILVVGCLSVAGLSVAMGERSYKGDRLQVASKHSSSVSPQVVTTRPRPLIGCEPAFSHVADPKRSDIFGRCIS